MTTAALAQPNTGDIDWAPASRSAADSSYLGLPVYVIQFGAPALGGGVEIVQRTARGDIRSTLHISPDGVRLGVLVLHCDEQDGQIDDRCLHGHLRRRLPDRGISLMHLRHREPGNSIECLLDALTAAHFLRAAGARRIAIIGEAQTAPLAVRTAALLNHAAACVAIRPARSEHLGPRPGLTLGSRCPLLLADHQPAHRHADSACTQKLLSVAAQSELLALPDTASGISEHAIVNICEWIEQKLW